MLKCTYCGKMYEDSKGMILVDSASGKVSYFCSGKCRKYYGMKRKKGRWADGTGQSFKKRRKKVKKRAKKRSKK